MALSYVSDNNRVVIAENDNFELQDVLDYVDANVSDPSVFYEILDEPEIDTTVDDTVKIRKTCLLKGEINSAEDSDFGILGKWTLRFDPAAKISVRGSVYIISESPDSDLSAENFKDDTKRAEIFEKFDNGEYQASDVTNEIQITSYRVATLSYRAYDGIFSVEGNTGKIVIFGATIYAATAFGVQTNRDSDRFPIESIGVEYINTSEKENQFRVLSSLFKQLYCKYVNFSVFPGRPFLMFSNCTVISNLSYLMAANQGSDCVYGHFIQTGLVGRHYAEDKTILGISTNSNLSKGSVFEYRDCMPDFKNFAIIGRTAAEKANTNIGTALLTATYTINTMLISDSSDVACNISIRDTDNGDRSTTVEDDNVIDSDLRDSQDDEVLTHHYDRGLLWTATNIQNGSQDFVLTVRVWSRTKSMNQRGDGQRTNWDLRAPFVIGLYKYDLLIESGSITGQDGGSFPYFFRADTNAYIAESDLPQAVSVQFEAEQGIVDSDFEIKLDLTQDSEITLDELYCLIKSAICSDSNVEKHRRDHDYLNVENGILTINPGVALVDLNSSSFALTINAGSLIQGVVLTCDSFLSDKLILNCGASITVKSSNSVITNLTVDNLNPNGFSGEYSLSTTIASTVPFVSYKLQGDQSFSEARYNSDGSQAIIAISNLADQATISLKVRSKGYWWKNFDVVYNEGEVIIDAGLSFIADRLGEPLYTSESIDKTQASNVTYDDGFIVNNSSTSIVNYSLETLFFAMQEILHTSSVISLESVELLQINNDVTGFLINGTNDFSIKLKGTSQASINLDMTLVYSEDGVDGVNSKSGDIAISRLKGNSSGFQILARSSILIADISAATGLLAESIKPNLDEIEANLDELAVIAGSTQEVINVSISLTSTNTQITKTWGNVVSDMSGLYKKMDPAAIERLGGYPGHFDPRDNETTILRGEYEVYEKIHNYASTTRKIYIMNRRDNDDNIQGYHINFLDTNHQDFVSSPWLYKSRDFEAKSVFEFETTDGWVLKNDSAAGFGQVTSDINVTIDYLPLAEMLDNNLERINQAIDDIGDVDTSGSGGGSSSGSVGGASTGSFLA